MSPERFDEYTHLLSDQARVAAAYSLLDFHSPTHAKTVYEAVALLKTIFADMGRVLSEMEAREADKERES